MPSRGILITNLGSPDAADAEAVGRYLSEFLGDPYVIDLPKVIRQFVVDRLIVPRRRERSANAYAEIWNDDAPLRSITDKLALQLEQQSGMRTAVGMRYGRPSLQDALQLLDGTDEILFLPLYPQHAGSTRTTAIEALRQLRPRQEVWVLQPFYGDSDYRELCGRHLQSHIGTDTDHVVFSFHGLPERHLRTADTTRRHCLKVSDCCAPDTPSAAHATCYRYQCEQSANWLSEWIEIPWGLSYQSRLGPLKWLQPYTDEYLAQLVQAGKTRIAVCCPSFTADNLETLHEIDIEARQALAPNGLADLQLIPSLNDTVEWVDLLTKWSTGDPLLPLFKPLNEC